MHWLSKLEKKLGWLAFPNLTVTLIFGQVVTFIFANTNPDLLDMMKFVPANLLHGEAIWTLFTFPFIPPSLHPIWLFFALYIFYLFGTGLESYWGDFKYTCYLLIAYLATVALSFLTPMFPVGNAYMLSSVFFAFAYLNPNFELMIMFILPVKIKWLALITAFFYTVALVRGPMATRLQIVAAVLNFGIFFGPQIVWYLRRGVARQERTIARAQTNAQARHRCASCGRTDKTDPELEFRYREEGEELVCYCLEHLPGYVPEEEA